MLDYLKFAGVFFGAIALAPLVLGLLSVVLGSAGVVLLVFGVLSAVVALAIGAVVLFVHGMRCARQIPDPLHRAVTVLASPMLTIVVLLSIVPLALVGHHLGRLADPVSERPRHEGLPPIIVQPPPPP